jgi:hypothetical protein
LGKYYYLPYDNSYHGLILGITAVGEKCGSKDQGNWVEPTRH